MHCHACARSGSGGGTKRATLQGIQKGPGELPSPDAKPEYFSCSGTVTFVNPDQTLYYMAAPENNRKVRATVLVWCASSANKSRRCMPDTFLSLFLISPRSCGLGVDCVACLRTSCNQRM